MAISFSRSFEKAKPYKAFPPLMEARSRVLADLKSISKAANVKMPKVRRALGLAPDCAPATSRTLEKVGHAVEGLVRAADAEIRRRGEQQDILETNLRSEPTNLWEAVQMVRDFRQYVTVRLLEFGFVDDDIVWTWGTTTPEHYLRGHGHSMEHITVRTNHGPPRHRLVDYVMSRNMITPQGAREMIRNICVRAWNNGPMCHDLERRGVGLRYLLKVVPDYDDDDRERWMDRVQREQV